MKDNGGAGPVPPLFAVVKGHGAYLLPVPLMAICFIGVSGSLEWILRVAA